LSFDAYSVSPEGNVIISEDVYTTFNSTVNLTCSAEGGPNNVYEWRKQGVLIYNLYFPMVTGSDGGVYQCRVINAAGSDTATTLLSGVFIILIILPHTHYIKINMFKQ